MHDLRCCVIELWALTPRFPASVDNSVEDVHAGIFIVQIAVVLEPVELQLAARDNALWHGLAFYDVWI
jgi:hypothetical protein